MRASEDFPATTPASRPTASGSTRTRLGMVVAAHAVVDLLSAIVIPILSVLEGRLSLTPAQGASLIAVGSISSGVIQPLVAIVSDRLDTRWLGTAGLVVAALALGCVGLAENYPQLMLIQILGTAGIGAFHPVGAAAAGHLGGKSRAGAISIFYAAGLAGGVGGAIGVPSFVASRGVEALVWCIPPSLLMALALAWAIHAVPHKHASARAHHHSLPDGERRRRWRDVGLLYAGNALRFITNMMLVQFIVRWCELRALSGAGQAELTEQVRTAASRMNGLLQGGMATGMGVSGLLLGALLPVRYAKATLVAFPLAGSIAILLFARAGGLGEAIPLAACMGAGYAAVMPLTITMAQRLLPHRTSLASALMMGGAWALAAVGPPIAQELLSRGVTLGQGFAVTAGVLFVSALLALPMGKLPEDHRG